MMSKMNDGAETRETDDAPALAISALMDGALSGAEASAALTAAARPDGQACWRMYHLIGEAMRAPAGASAFVARHDAILLAKVRAAIEQPAALALEPVALPATIGRQAANDGVFRWKLVSGCASLVAVAAIGWGAWGMVSAPPAGLSGQSGRSLAQARSALVQPGSSAVVAQAVPRPDAAASAITLDDQHLALNTHDDGSRMLRDPQLDRLLAAHRGMVAFGGGPSDFLRSATFEEPDR